MFSIIKSALCEIITRLKKCFTVLFATATKDDTSPVKEPTAEESKPTEEVTVTPVEPVTEPVEPTVAEPVVKPVVKSKLELEADELDRFIREQTGMTSEELSGAPLKESSIKVEESRSFENSLDQPLQLNSDTVQWGNKPDHEKLKDVIGKLESNQLLTAQQREFYVTFYDRREAELAAHTNSNVVSDLDKLFGSGAPVQPKAERYQAAKPVKSIFDGELLNPIEPNSNSKDQFQSELDFLLDNAPDYVTNPHEEDIDFSPEIGGWG